MKRKTCSRCGRQKALSSFYKGQAYCKQCCDEYATQYQANQQRVRDMKTSRQIANGICPECKNVTLIPRTDPASFVGFVDGTIGYKVLGKICGECKTEFLKGGVIKKNDNLGARDREPVCRVQ